MMLSNLRSPLKSWDLRNGSLSVLLHRGDESLSCYIPSRASAERARESMYSQSKRSPSHTLGPSKWKFFRLAPPLLRIACTPPALDDICKILLLLTPVRAQSRRFRTRSLLQSQSFCETRQSDDTLALASRERRRGAVDFTYILKYIYPKLWEGRRRLVLDGPLWAQTGDGDEVPHYFAQMAAPTWERTLPRYRGDENLSCYMPSRPSAERARECMYSQSKRSPSHILGPSKWKFFRLAPPLLRIACTPRALDATRDGCSTLGGGPHPGVL
uniref:Uncharacterized protein n=1 Tax=Sicyonia whispovirus TaxID=2984283 RepID=A0A9C7EZ28_9VIRU|nr:MAG: hypothetical protein [Sicyonia whispovirus]